MSKEINDQNELLAKLQRKKIYYLARAKILDDCVYTLLHQVRRKYQEEFGDHYIIWSQNPREPEKGDIVDTNTISRQVKLPAIITLARQYKTDGQTLMTYEEFSKIYQEAFKDLADNDKEIAAFIEKNYD